MDPLEQALDEGGFEALGAGGVPSSSAYPPKPGVSRYPAAGAGAHVGHAREDLHLDADPAFPSEMSPHVPAPLETSGVAGGLGGGAPPGTAGHFDLSALGGPGGAIYGSPDGNRYPAAARSPGSGIDEDIQMKTEELVQETLERIGRVHGVIGAVILDADGLVLRATLPPADASRYAAAACQLLQRARAVVREPATEPGDVLTMLRVRTRKHELVICAEAVGKYALLVVQNPYLSATTDDAALANGNAA